MNSVDLNNLIISNVVTNGHTPASDLRDVLDEVVIAIFGDKLIYSATVSGILYNLTFEKRGSLCYVRGTIKNNNAFISGVTLTIPDAIYYSTDATYLTTTRWINGYISSVNVDNNTISLLTSLGVAHEVFINGFYKILE